MTENNILKVKSTFWQNGISLVIFMLLSICAVRFFCCKIWPHQFISKDDFIDSNIFEKSFYIGCSISIFLLGIYIWWSTIKYELCADENSIWQTNGFYYIRASWNDIHHYTFEKVKGYRYPLKEPILYNSNGDVIFRCRPHILVSSSTQIDQRSVYGNM